MFFDLPPVQPSAEVVIASDYVRDGVSLTNGETVYQGAVRLDMDKVYVKAGVAAGDFALGADTEAQLAIGARTDFAGFQVDASATYTNYRGVIAGVDNEEVDYRVTASREVGPINAAVSYQYNPDAFGGVGKEHLVDTRVTLPVKFAGAQLNGGVGRVWSDAGDYTIWNAGVTKNFAERYAVDARYFDSNAEERFGTAYGDRFVVSLRASF